MRSSIFAIWRGALLWGAVELNLKAVKWLPRQNRAIKYRAVWWSLPNHAVNHPHIIISGNRDGSCWYSIVARLPAFNQSTGRERHAIDIKCQKFMHSRTPFRVNSLRASSRYFPYCIYLRHQYHLIISMPAWNIISRLRERVISRYRYFSRPSKISAVAFMHIAGFDEDDAHLLHLLLAYDEAHFTLSKFEMILFMI